MVQCDVCENAAGSIYCFADAAVMCQACDRTVHGANKLAAKHDRVTLSKAAESAQCDICQDRPAVLFCSEDRALICRRCDIMIHTANEFTAQHHRYLLSGTTLGLKSLGGENAESADKRSSDSKASSASALTRDAIGVSTRSSAGAGPSGLGVSEGGLGMRLSSRATPRSMSSGALVEVPAAATPMGDTWISGRGIDVNSKAAMTPSQEQDQLRSEQAQMAAAQQGQAGSIGLMPGFSSGTLSDFLGAQPSSSGGNSGANFTLAHELLGLPTMSQAFSAKDIDAAYLFQDMGDIDDDLSSLLVPDLDFSSIAAFPEPSVPKIPQTGGFANRFDVSTSPGSAGDHLVPDGVVPDISASPVKRQRI
ncbi:probable B-box zinc finger protein 22 at N-terminal half [Coccomyxa sp. Obi]|nr:probable B-box zinc finger protein 22 at N-terminal half [Coccomyxa sp. Obi]